MGQNKSKSILFTPAEGCHYLWYRGRPTMFHRTEEHYTSMWPSGCGFHVSEVRTYSSKLLAEAQQTYIERDEDQTVIYQVT